MKPIFVFIFSFFFFTISFAQKTSYTISSIPDSLTQNANAVVRLNQLDILISSQRKMIITQKRIVSVLNEKGLEAIEAQEYYNKTTSVNSINAIIYSASGDELKKIKRKDFRDQCSIDGVTLFSDSRFIYLNYTPTEYPFTIEYNSEVETSNTAFIAQWYPLSDYFVSIEKSVLNVNYPENLGFKKKEFNFGAYNIKKTIDSATQLSYTASNFIAQKSEENSPSFFDVFPRVMMGLEHFNLEGVDGNAKTWKEYGKWFYDNILTGTDELLDETKTKIKLLVGNEKDPIKKAKIVYKYMQERTRYVSIQVGIGGFKPMLAKDVDRLGYGDCKALSNYTRALLKAVDVTSYYVELYGSPNKINIQSDFFSIQGNHAILCIPNENSYVFLECTSQDNPFGYQANFTDDRDVVIIKPEGGEVVRTQNYQDKDNVQHSIGSYSLTENGDFSGSISIISEGSRYGRKEGIEKMQPTEKEAHYKAYWSNIGNLKINKESFVNDKQKIAFTENIDISAVSYCKNSGNSLIFAVNAFNPYEESIKRIRNRKTPFLIQRGVYDTDEISITLPNTCSIEFLPQNVEINNKFGEYKTEIIKKEDHNIIYKRTFFLKKGKYQKNEYDDYRLFMEQVSRNDNAKIILTKN